MAHRPRNNPWLQRKATAIMTDAAEMDVSESKVAIQELKYTASSHKVVLHASNRFRNPLLQVNQPVQQACTTIQNVHTVPHPRAPVSSALLKSKVPSLLNVQCKQNKMTATTNFVKPVYKQSLQEEHNAKPRFFKVMRTKDLMKKHKSWLDGMLELIPHQSMRLISEDNTTITKITTSNNTFADFHPGDELEIGRWLVELENEISQSDYDSGRAFLSSNEQCVSKISQVPKRCLSVASSVKQLTTMPTVRDNAIRRRLGNLLFNGNAAASFISPNEAKINPWASYYNLINPFDANHFILNRDRVDFENPAQGECPVIVDEFLAKHLRPHQKSGIEFMYQCLEQSSQPGCILADEMGLGKSLQLIALVWTLLRHSAHGSPAIRRCMIVVPTSLTKNWIAEFQKWCGNRLKVLELNSQLADNIQRSHISVFCSGHVYTVLILSYEQLKKHSDRLRLADGCLLVSDEAQRLKSALGNKLTRVFASMPMSKRVLISGSPIQNDLMEFYAMVNLARPGIWGSLQSFRNTFERPISRSRDKDCTKNEKQVGEERMQEIVRKASAFMIRRTQAVLKCFLPPKITHLVFCPLTSLQRDLYTRILQSNALKSAIQSGDKDASVLRIITLLRKLCNHPSLIRKDAEQADKVLEPELYECLDLICKSKISASNMNQSCKMWVLQQLLNSFVHVQREKVVVAANSVAALDLIEEHCRRLSYSFLRLDGQTKSTVRQVLVERWNRLSTDMVFLLSTHAGGVGLNLIGGRIIIMVDHDWNPVINAQTLARVWRDGQERATIVISLVAAGTIDEKMVQRGFFKSELASSIADKQRNVHRNFSSENLHDLFTLHSARCNTYNTLASTDSDKNVSECDRSAKIGNNAKLLISNRFWHCVQSPQECTIDPQLHCLAADSVSFIMSQCISKAEDEDMLSVLVADEYDVEVNTVFADKLDDVQMQNEFSQDKFCEAREKAYRVNDEDDEAELTFDNINDFVPSQFEIIKHENKIVQDNK